jgi:hypothetical protein
MTNRPDLSGTIEYPDGAKVSVALWANKGKRGAPHFMGRVDPVEDKDDEIDY